ncbi:acetyl-CoA sensor PanZ family protein [Paraferrimonas haliotis]|uniref:PanZ acetyltransferase (GNAT) domain-containing protein n=1 Tax=Paraferrimonas haliotis TaxID=2013866 RepID=A0AA37TUK8_9GAMM|nr:acetyl-CoA sensor PanZ family protein [Paraferrimonas haliotis]GLS82031.1 hypothetical protein GCM10007894_00080 [Paraferrimonas haliotis]
MRLTVSQVVQTSPQLESDLQKVCQDNEQTQRLLDSINTGKLFCSTFNDRHIGAVAISAQGMVTSLVIGQPNRRRGIGSDLITQTCKLLKGELPQLSVDLAYLPTEQHLAMQNFLRHNKFIQNGLLWHRKVTV